MGRMRGGAIGKAGPPLVLALLAAPLEHIETITQSPHSYQITVGGTLDHEITRAHQGYSLPWKEGFQPNRFISIANIGRRDLVNPRVLVGERGGWRSLPDILSAAILPGMTDEEKALALWAFMMENVYRVDQSWGVRYLDPVAALNSYGFAECSGSSTHLGRLAEAAGLEARLSGPDHWIANIDWEGESHVLDPDLGTFFFQNDGSGLAGEMDLVTDHDLVRRTHTEWIGAYDHPAHDAELASAFDASRTFEDLVRPSPRDMSYRLRPGETIYRSWQNWGKFASYGFGPDSYRVPPPVYGNGRVSYAPDLQDTLFLQGTEGTSNLSCIARDGLAPNVHPARTGRWAQMIVRMTSPYVLVGGTVRGTWIREHNTDRCRLFVSSDGSSWQQIWDAQQLDRFPATISLDDWIAPHDRYPRFEFWLRFDFLSRTSVTMTGLDSLVVEADFQLSPRSLPSLLVGENEVVYQDDTSGERLARITHGWGESAATRPPLAPVPLTPLSGAPSVPLRPVFAWQEAQDPDGDPIADYEIQVSRRADFRWPVSPNFDRYISRTPSQGQTSWAPPYEGLLLPGTIYYWRVRACDAMGAWGPWSAPQSFSPDGPGQVENLSFRQKGKSILLQWEPSPSGSAAVAYRIYGADEQGFSPGAETLVAEVAQTSCEVVTPTPVLPNQNRAFYRVVAVDSRGVESAPCPARELPHPFVFSEPITRARTGEAYAYAIGVLTAIEYDREVPADSLVVSARVLPPWLSLTAPNFLVGFPQATDEGDWPVEMGISERHGWETIQRFVVRVEGGTGTSAQLPLEPGFDLVCLPIAVDDVEPATVFASILDNLEYAMAWTGESLYFSPSQPAASTLDAVRPSQGCWLKMRGRDTLQLAGAIREPSEIHLPLQAGWNLVPCLVAAPDSVAHAFSVLGTNLRMVMGCGEQAGAAYDPGLPRFSTLRLVRPGRGYWVQVLAPDTLVYSGETVGPLEPRPGGGASPPSWEAGPAARSPYWANLYGSDLTVGGLPAPIGLSIHVVDPQGTICGAGEIQAPGELGFLPVWGDDPATEADEGAVWGDTLRVLLGGTQRVFSVAYAGFGGRMQLDELTGSDPGNPPDSLVEGEVRFDIAAANPSLGDVQFRMVLPRAQAVTLQVFSPTGRLVRTVLDARRLAGESMVTWDGRNSAGERVAPGLYAASLAYAGGHLSRKLVIAH